MTPRQSRLLTFISFYRELHGYSPSLDEMTTAMDLKSKSVVHRMLQKLHYEGRIRHKPKAVRSVEVVSTATGRSLGSYSEEQLVAELRQRRMAKWTETQ